MATTVVNVDNINPIDYWNKHCIQHTIDLLLSLKNVQQSSIDSLTYVINKTDEKERMVVVEDSYWFVAKMPNGFEMTVGEKYTSFMMLQKFVYKGSFLAAMNYVMYDVMNTRNDYVRVGTKYFQKIQKIDRYGVRRTKLTVWDKPTIVDDYGKKFLEKIQKFKDFTIIPDNKEHLSVVDGNYNVYAPFDHVACKPEDYKGVESWPWIENLLKHIFGEQWLLGIIYLKVLYDHPKQALPILVLISEERSTGKTTFLDFLNVLFGDNTVVINPQDINNSFNSTYADKNIIMIEESHFDSKQATEKLKNLSTQKKIAVNTKFVAQHSLPFYGKLIITSNDEDRFSKVDDPEIRYWVRKVPTLQGKENHAILDSLTEEIPAFLYFLDNMWSLEEDTGRFFNEDGVLSIKGSRMVFLKEELETKELRTVKEESKQELHKEIEMYLDNHCILNREVKTFYFVALDVKKEFFLNNNQYSATYINKILRSSMKLEKLEKTKRYIPLEKNSSSQMTPIPGKPFIYHNKYAGMKIEDSDDIEDADIPF